MIRGKYEPLKKIMDERRCRIWAATEAKAIGWGGVSMVATATGLSRTTITAAMKELNQLIEGKKIEIEKVRRHGGGRKPLIEKDPTLIQDLEMLLEPVSRGDLESPLQWTCKSTRKLAEELKKQNHKIGDRKVAQLLHDLDYSLQSNRKTKEGASHPDRDAQFEYINTKTKLFQAKGQPVISGRVPDLLNRHSER